DIDQAWKDLGNNPPTAGFVMSLGMQSISNGSIPLSLVVPPGRSAIVLLNGASPNSFDPDGAVATWNWSIDGFQVSSASSFYYPFAKGTHQVSLIVTDNNGASSPAATGTIVVTEMPSGNPLYTIKDLGTLGGIVSQ